MLTESSFYFDFLLIRYIVRFGEAFGVVSYWVGGEGGF